MLNNTTLEVALIRYRESVSVLKKGYVQEYYRIQKILTHPLASLAVNQITSVDIAAYRDERLAQKNPKTNKNISPATVRLEMSLLSNLFDIARIEWGYCEGNPVTNVRKPKPSPGRERRLSPREERYILRYCEHHKNRELLAIVTLAIETAMRQSEIINMTWENICLKSRIVQLLDTKNGHKRDVPLSLKARDTLASLKSGGRGKGRVFTYTSNGIKSSWRYMMKALNIEDLRFHDLRHEAISRLFENTDLDMMEVSAISGHRSLAMLKRYTHLKAQKLVRKLDAKKSQSKRVILNALIPYPAEIRYCRPSAAWAMCLPDFEPDLYTYHPTLEQAQTAAQDLLLRTLVQRLRSGETIPKPDHYLKTVHESHIVMIDPMA